MKHQWILLALFMAVPASARPLPEGADERRVAHEDVRRLMQLVIQRSQVEAAQQRDDYREERDLGDQIMAELYGPSPNLALVEQLDKRRRELARKAREFSEGVADRVYRGLPPEDRLKFMKMTYPLPPRIITSPARETPKPAN